MVAMEEVENNKSILILGNSAYCFKPGTQLASLGFEVTVATSSLTDARGSTGNSKSLKVLSQTKLLDFSGQVGSFRAAFKLKDGTKTSGKFGCVIIALECQWMPSLGKWGIAEGDGVASLSRLRKDPARYLARLSSENRIVFLSGFKHNSYPVSQRQMVEQAIAIKKETNAHVHILTEQFKVAMEGLERTFREARDAGIIFVKFTEVIPQVTAKGDQIIISYFDESLARSVSLTPKLVVFEDEAAPPKEVGTISRLLEITLDRQGFLQGDSLHNRPVFTNRAGIFVVGSGKGPIADAEAEREAEAATMEVIGLLHSFDRLKEKASAKLDETKCGACLTCYRICPHRAISVYYGKAKPQISTLACRLCGLCAAACPMKAIDLETYERDKILSTLETTVTKMVSEANDGRPRILVFACENSAYDAYLLAKYHGAEINAHCGVLGVPCGGRVETESIIKALGSGVDGVAVLTCHNESCKSVYGNVACEQRIEKLKDMLKQLGLDTHRLLFAPVAPGSGDQFAKLINEFGMRLCNGGNFARNFRMGSD